MKKKSGIREFFRMGKKDQAFMLFVYATLIVFTILTLYPILFVISASISDPKAVSSGEMLLWPVGINLNGYKHLLEYKAVWVGYANALYYTLVGTFLNLLVTIPAAYALSRKDLKGRNQIMMLFVITMYFSGGLIPEYLNARSFGLVNTRAMMLIAGLVNTYNLIVCRTFFANSIPWELHEAAHLDGASDIKAFTKIALPLSKPILAVMMLYYGESHWNTYFSAMVYLRDQTKWPLQLVLRKILMEAQGVAAMMTNVTDPETIRIMMQQQDVANQLKYAIIIVATVPMLILYPFLEKYFAKGVMVGSVKG